VEQVSTQAILVTNEATRLTESQIGDEVVATVEERSTGKLKVTLGSFAIKLDNSCSKAGWGILWIIYTFELVSAFLTQGIQYSWCGASKYIGHFGY
jgi:hypothetical protein